MYQVFAIPAFSDNYLWALVHSNGNCAIIDPGDAEVVIEFLNQNNYTLTDILLTHHHNDHIGGVNTLITRYPNINVYGPATDRFDMVTKPCKDNQQIYLDKLECQFTVMAVPGHTIDHISYYDQSSIFLGDTLFSAGCGRLFEGTAAQMHQSLSKVAQLNSKTQVYCAHEYTLANIDFALTVDPNNRHLIEYQKQSQVKRANNRATIPTSLSTELLINPFLRANNNSIKQAVAEHFNLNTDISEVDCFTYLRKWKDTF